MSSDRLLVTPSPQPVPPPELLPPVDRPGIAYQPDPGVPALRLPEPASRDLVYLSGPPAAGKSTLMAALTGSCVRDAYTRPFARDTLTPPGDAAELGRRRDRFPGTDTLPMNVVVAAEEWMRGDGRTFRLILGEGDRLANMRFLSASVAAGWIVTLVHVDAPQELLDARCAGRGSHQSETWRKGRSTKARRLAAHAEATGRIRVIELDSRNTTDCMVDTLLEALPVLRTLQPAPLGQMR